MAKGVCYSIVFLIFERYLKRASNCWWWLPLQYIAVLNYNRTITKMLIIMTMILSFWICKTSGHTHASRLTFSSWILIHQAVERRIYLRLFCRFSFVYVHAQKNIAEDRRIVLIRNRIIRKTKNKLKKKMSATNQMLLSAVLRPRTKHTIAINTMRNIVPTAAPTPM